MTPERQAEIERLLADATEGVLVYDGYERIFILGSGGADVCRDVMPRNGPLFAAAPDLARMALDQAAENARLRGVLYLADDALTEAEAILGGEYGDHYGSLCETMLKLRSQIAEIEV